MHMSSSVVINKLISDIHDFTVMNYRKQSIIRVQDASVILNFQEITDDCINSFVKNVVVSIIKGNQFFFDEEDNARVFTVNRKLIFFTETSIGECFEILDEDLCDVLSQFPEFAISHDGMMVFYTSQKLVATYDCKTCICLKPKELNLSSFNSISQGEDGNLVVKGKNENELELKYYMFPEFFPNEKPLLENLEFIIIP